MDNFVLKSVCLQIRLSPKLKAFLVKGPPVHHGFLSLAEDLDLSVIVVSLISEDESTLISSVYEGYFISFHCLPTFLLNNISVFSTVT